METGIFSGSNVTIKSSAKTVCFFGEMHRCAFFYEVVRNRYTCSVSMNLEGCVD